MNIEMSDRDFCGRSLYIELVIILVIIIVLFQCSIYNIQYRCPKESLRISYMRGSRTPPNIHAERVGIPTIDLKLDRDVPCGIYRTSTAFGDGSIFINKNDNRKGYLYLIDNKDKAVDGVNLWDLWNIDRVESTDNHFIATYNKGCC
jgi:hypothetical protein